MRGMKRALLLVLVVTSLAAGCAGGDGGGGDDEPSAKQAYLNKAEAVCARVNTEIDQAKKQQPTSADAIPPYVKKLIDLARTNVQELSALTSPPDDAADLKAKVLDPLTEQLKIGDAYSAKVDAAAKAKDPILLQLITNPPTETKADLAFMKAYGFKACVTAADTGAASK
jgi:hypothetical protein